MSSTPSPERYRLELVAQPHRVPAVVRLRRLLKRLLRTHGFKCTRVERIDRR
ncbi:MAG: hypothetical protein AB7I48_23790 [Planctomycetaceae bacterium]